MNENDASGPSSGGAKPRIVDIALQAGVSTATVDRVLNGRPGVKGKTVSKVRDAAEWLAKSGGRPTVVASSLKALTIDILLAGGPGFANEILMREFHRASRLAGVKLNARGWQSLYEPRAQLVHHESVSRGVDRDPVGAKRQAGELATLRSRWGVREPSPDDDWRSRQADPFHHPALSPFSEQFELRV